MRSKNRKLSIEFYLLWKWCFCWVSLVAEMLRRSNFMKILKILKNTTPKINRLSSKHFNISKILNDNCLSFNHFHPVSTFNLNSNSGWEVFTWLSLNLGCYCWYFNPIFLDTQNLSVVKPTLVYDRNNPFIITKLICVLISDASDNLWSTCS